MSADNYRKCPKCNATELERQDKAKKAAEKKYGAVTPEEYMKLLDKAKPQSLGETLRENYELGIVEDGRFFLHYRASCDRCDFDFNFSHQVQANPPHALTRGTP